MNESLILVLLSGDQFLLSITSHKRKVVKDPSGADNERSDLKVKMFQLIRIYGLERTALTRKRKQRYREINVLFCV